MKSNTFIHNSMTGNFFNKILILLTLVTTTTVSCDGLDFFKFAEEMSNYGPKWYYDDVAAAVVVTFPEDVINADVAANYTVHYNGSTGSVAISAITYDTLTRTATIPITYNTTDGSKFWIEIISSATPITMGTRVLEGINSPSWRTPGGVISVTQWNSSWGQTFHATTNLGVTFSENVSNADYLGNYQVAYSGGSGSVYISSVTYDSGTRTATLSIMCNVTDGSTVSFNIIEGASPITNGYVTLTSASSPNYYTPDLAAPYILVWDTGGITNITDSVSTTITVNFSEDVVNGNVPGNYTFQVQTGNFTNLQIDTINYGSSNSQVVMTITARGTFNSTFIINAYQPGILDGASNALSSMNMSSPEYTLVP